MFFPAQFLIIFPYIYKRQILFFKNYQNQGSSPSVSTVKSKLTVYMGSSL